MIVDRFLTSPVSYAMMVADLRQEYAVEDAEGVEDE